MLYRYPGDAQLSLIVYLVCPDENQVIVAISYLREYTQLVGFPSHMNRS